MIGTKIIIKQIITTVGDGVVAANCDECVFKKLVGGMFNYINRYYYYFV